MIWLHVLMSIVLIWGYFYTSPTYQNRCARFKRYNRHRWMLNNRSTRGSRSPPLLLHGPSHPVPIRSPSSCSGALLCSCVLLHVHNFLLNGKTFPYIVVRILLRWCGLILPLFLLILLRLFCVWDMQQKYVFNVHRIQPEGVRALVRALRLMDASSKTGP